MRDSSIMEIRQLPLFDGMCDGYFDRLTRGAYVQTFPPQVDLVHQGDRPDFPFDGAWIYVGETATVHLIVIANEAENAASLKLEHFAFSATGIAGFVELLKGRGIAHSLDPVPGFPVVQVNLHDPDGNHIHVDFPAEEAAQMV